MKSYEAVFIFPEALKEDEVNQTLGEACEEIEKLGGKVLTRNKLGKRTFARRLKKQTAGYYAVVTFQLPPDKVSALNARYKLNERIFRVQIVKLTDRKPITGPKVERPETEEENGIAE